MSTSCLVVSAFFFSLFVSVSLALAEFNVAEDVIYVRFARTVAMYVHGDIKGSKVIVHQSGPKQVAMFVKFGSADWSHARVAFARRVGRPSSS